MPSERSEKVRLSDTDRAARERRMAAAVASGCNDRELRERFGNPSYCVQVAKRLGVTRPELRKRAKQ